LQNQFQQLNLQEGWGKLRDVGRKIFEPTGKRTPESESLYGFLFLLSGFTLQLTSSLLGTLTDSYQSPWPINWQAVAAVATFLVVLVALGPIILDANRRRAQARSLRIRLCSKLTLLRPSLGSIIQGGTPSYPAAILSPESFRETIMLIQQMMTDPSVLRANEQDQMALVLANLEFTAALFGTPEFTARTAKNILDLIDRAVKIMGQEGLLSGRVEVPWEGQ